MNKSSPELTRIGRFMALLLRHDPGRAGLTLDASGWAPVAELLRGLARRGFEISPEMLRDLVQSDAKGRYAFSPDGRRIRASQGHSIQVDLGLSAVVPPDRLYHGTGERFLEAILAAGLRPMGRHHVHLSGDLQTATVVGSRRGRPVILLVDARGMCEAGHLFYRSANGVWLTDTVPPRFLNLLQPGAAANGRA